MSRKNELKATAPDDLRKLPSFSTESFDALGKPQSLGVWHDKTAKGEDLVVVQCKRYIFLGFGYMFAAGFVLDGNNQVRDAEGELMWDYI